VAAKVYRETMKKRRDRKRERERERLARMSIFAELLYLLLDFYIDFRIALLFFK